MALLTDRKYLIVDSIDGRTHYAETDKLAGHDALEPGTMVALSGGGGKSKMRNARIEVVSYWPVERLPTDEAATWLDQAIVADKKPAIHEKGFGADVSEALVAREEWLIANRHASVEQAGTITPKPDMLRNLNHRGMTVAAEKMSAQLGMPHPAPLEGLRMTGKQVGTFELPMQRLAVIKGGREFTLVPWRPELLLLVATRSVRSVGHHPRRIGSPLSRRLLGGQAPGGCQLYPYTVGIAPKQS